MAKEEGKRYSVKFKQKAVRKFYWWSLNDGARELGVQPRTLKRWIRQAEEGSKSIYPSRRHKKTKPIWYAILKHRRKWFRDEYQTIAATAIGITEVSGKVTLEIRFPNIWARYWKVSTPIKLNSTDLAINTAINLAESCLESNETLFDLVHELAGRDLPDLPDGFDNISCAYKYHATSLDAESFIYTTESSGSHDKIITLDWGPAIRALPRDKWVEHREFILAFMIHAPFNYGHWSHWKWLFKQMDKKFHPEFSSVLLARIDTEGFLFDDNHKPALNNIGSWNAVSDFPANDGTYILSGIRTGDRFGGLIGIWEGTRQAPLSQTICYLQRRGQRYMQNLSRQSPALYMDVAKRLIKYSKSYYREHDWIMGDILYGGSGRWTVSSHGRKRFFPRFGPGSTATREERLPGYWDMEIPFLESLYTDKDAPWEYSEFAARVLLDNEVELPVLKMDALSKFMESNSPILAEIGLAQHLNSDGLLEDLNTEVVSFIYTIASTSLRSQIKGLLSNGIGDEGLFGWRYKLWEEFQAGLNGLDQGDVKYMSANCIQLYGRSLYFRVVKHNVDIKDRRYRYRYNENAVYDFGYFHIEGNVEQDINEIIKRNVATLLLESLHDVLQQNVALLAPLVKYLPNELSEDNLERIRNLIPSMGIHDLITLVCDQKTRKWLLRDQLITAIKNNIKTHWAELEADLEESKEGGERHVERRFWEILSRPYLQLLLNDEPELKSLSWELAKLYSKKDELVRFMWTRAMYEGPPIEEFINLKQTHATLLATGNLGLLYIVDGAQAAPVSKLNVSSVIYLLQHAEAGDLEELIARLDEEQWSEVIQQLHQQPSEAVELGGLWNHIWELFAGTDVPGRFTDLANDKQLLDLLCQHLPTPDLVVLSPLQFNIVETWLENNPQRFVKDQDLLYRAASNPEPKISGPAIRLAIEHGLTAEFALRLLESGLPACVAAGLEFYNSLPSGDEQETEYALILCDSPNAQVQEAGLEFIKERWSTLPITRVLGDLAEHRSSHIQAFVAEQLAENSIPAEKLLEFDRHVLRERNRGRSAKEKVKERLGRGAGQKVQADSAQPAAIYRADYAERLPVLVETARGRVRKDSDWALALLVQASLDGEDIDGLSIDGPVGG